MYIDNQVSVPKSFNKLVNAQKPLISSKDQQRISHEFSTKPKVMTPLESNPLVEIHIENQFISGKQTLHNSHDIT